MAFAKHLPICLSLAVKQCVAAVKPGYALFGAEDRLVAIPPEGGHSFPAAAREAAYRFIDKALGNGAVAGEKP